MSEVELTRSGPVATLTLNRPQVRNALDLALIAQLTQLFRALAMDDTRVIVLTGAGDAFCAGGDAEWMRRSRELTDEANVADAAAVSAMLEAIDGCPKPVVARVNGHAMGGGAGLVACADVAVAAEGARFGFPEARLGLIPSTISPYVLRKIGPGHARALFVTGRRFDAAQAMRIGLVHGVVPAAELDAEVTRTVDDLLACGPVAIAEAKRLVRDATDDLVLPDLALRLASVRAAPEAQEGLAAFLAKQTPGWVIRSDGS
ncbi:MAG: enoyl-CoA hydratase-related protein [Gaiellales bacterium]